MQGYKIAQRLTLEHAIKQCLDRSDLKEPSVLHSMISFGSLFHSQIVRGKKKCWCEEVLNCGTTRASVVADLLS